MNRDDFRQLAEIRLKEAHALLDGSHWDGAYYLGGYAVECALKACIAKLTKQYDFPDKKAVNESYSHKLEQLLGAAGLGRVLDEAMETDKDLEVNWTVVKDWSEESRYQRLSGKQAGDLLAAIDNKPSGVLTWLQQYW